MPDPTDAPPIHAGWLLRAAAVAAATSAAFGVVVAPGVHGNASGAVVDRAELLTRTCDNFTWLALVAALLWGVLELLRAPHVPLLPRVALIATAAAVASMTVPALWNRLASPLSVLLASAAAIAALAGAYSSARAPHTRALAGILFALAFAAIARVGAWEIATAAGERASTRWFAVSRGFATAGVVFESLAQLFAAAWVGTRSRIVGQLGASAALGVALVLTWGVARGIHPGAAPWQAVMHTALADAPGVPSTFQLDAVATFLVPASILLALVAAAQPHQDAIIVAAIALALVSRGSLDAPIRAMCAAAAAPWAALACVSRLPTEPPRST